MDVIDKIYKCLAEIESQNVRRPARAYARPNFLAEAADSVSPFPKPPPLASFVGIPMQSRDILPPGVLCVFVDSNGTPVGIIVDETYTPSRKTTDNTESER